MPVYIEKAEIWSGVTDPWQTDTHTQTTEHRATQIVKSLTFKLSHAIIWNINNLLKFGRILHYFLFNAKLPLFFFLSPIWTRVGNFTTLINWRKFYNKMRLRKIYILRFLLKIINEKHFEVKHFPKSFFCCCSEKLNGAERAKGLIWNCETEPLWKGSMERCSIVFYLSTGNIMVGCMGAGSSYQMMFDATLTLKWALSRYIYIYWPPFHSTQILVLFKSDSTQN